MNQPECDIWFGPGGLKGVFGAGVAAELQIAIERGKIDPTRLRLFGSSVGCLTAAYLATGNAADGIRVFQEDVEGLITPSNLLPSLRARFANRVVRTVWDSRRVIPVPSMLDVDHALRVMMRRTPDVLNQLLEADMPIFAEYVHVRSGQFRHIELRTTPDPLEVIRHSLTCFPFAWSQETEVLDSGIAGYGFVNLIRRDFRKLVVVLNGDLSPSFREPLAGLASAVLAANSPVARLYLCRQRNRRLAGRSATRYNDRVLVITPKQTLRLRAAADFQRAYEEGRQAAGRIIDFARPPNSSKGISG